LGEEMKIHVIDLGFIEDGIFVSVHDSNNPTKDPHLLFNLKTRKRHVSVLFNTNTRVPLYGNVISPYNVRGINIDDYSPMTLDPRQIKMFERAATSFFTKEERVFLDKCGKDHTNGVNQIRLVGIALEDE
jgi:hypothetical protein